MEPLKPSWFATAVDLTQVLTYDEKHGLLLGGKPIPESQLVQLKSEAHVLEKLAIWRIITENLRAEWIAKGFNLSEDLESLKVAKGVVYVIDWLKGWKDIIKNAKKN